MNICFVSPGTVSHIPTLRAFLEELASEPFTNQLEVFEVFSMKSSQVTPPKGVQYASLGKIHDAMFVSDRSVLRRGSKYLKIILRLLEPWTQPKSLLLMTDSLLVGLLATLLCPRRVLLVYYQFEMVEKLIRGRLPKFILSLVGKKIALVIAPEANRLAIICDHLTMNNNKAFLLPNTNSGTTAEFKLPARVAEGTRLNVLSVGNIGETSTTWQPLLEAVSRLPVDRFNFKFVGNTNKSLMDMAQKLNLKNIDFIPPVLHGQLGQFYAEADVGLILYKDSAPNTKYCAPNKLYEYWASGLHVVGPNTPGITGVFDDPAMGSIVDLNDSAEIERCLKHLTALKSESSFRSSIQVKFEKRFSFKVYYPAIRQRLQEIMNVEEINRP